MAGLVPAIPNAWGTVEMMTIPTKTIAVRLFEYGGPEKLVVGEYELPPLGDRDVLVKNHAGSVSRWDVKYRTGELSDSRSRGLSPAAATGTRGGRRSRGHRDGGDAVQAERPGDRSDPSRGPRFGRDRAGAWQPVAQSGHPRPSDVRLLRAISHPRRTHVAAAARWHRLRAGRRRAVAVLIVAPGRERPAAGAARRQCSGHRRLRRHGPGDHAAGPARRRPRDRDDAARGQGRDLARARRRRGGRHCRRGAGLQGRIEAHERRRCRPRRRLHRRSGPAALSQGCDEARRPSRRHQRTGPRIPAVHR
jgi:hypothetical protein